MESDTAEDGDVEKGAKMRPKAQELHGEFLCWGCGEHGQNGSPDSSDTDCARAGMAKFCGNTRDAKVKLVSCGSSHTIVVTYTNDIYVWGNGHCGQLGVGDTEVHREPTLIQLYALQRENPTIQGVACGGRHTFVWLANGHMFSFGNNFFAQLGYDFREKNYKENQKRPHLLRTLTYRCVTQVACGEKHTIMLFKDGSVATVGNGANGQIGNNSRMEAVVPKQIEDIPKVAYVAAGAFHNIIVDVLGDLWTWGYSQACGRKKADVLFPEKKELRHANVVMVAGGQTHSAALTANGNVYTWGNGSHGQLGHGPDIKFLCHPARMRFRDLRCRVVHIGCGDSYTAAVTATGQLYMWGKNSHVIFTSKDPREAVWIPQLIDTRGRPIRSLACGAWHATAMTGIPDWKKVDDSSDAEAADDIVDDAGSDVTSESEEEIDLPVRPAMVSREKTAMSLAEFYAPSPSPTRDIGLSPSPDIMLGRRKNYHKGLPPPKSLRHYPKRSKKPGKSPFPWRGSDVDNHSSEPSRVTEASSLTSRQTQIGDKIDNEFPSAQTSRRQSNVSTDSNQEKTHQTLKRQVSFEAPSKAAYLKSETSLKRHRDSDASDLRSDSRTKTPLNVPSSVAVEFDVEQKLNYRDKLVKNKSPNSDLESQLPDLANGHVFKTRTLGKNSIATYRKETRLLSQGQSKHYGQGQTSNSSIRFVEKREHLGHGTIPFVQAPKLKYDSSPSPGFGMERELSIIRPSTIEFPNKGNETVRFRRIPKALRGEPLSRQNITISSEKENYNSSPESKKNGVQTDFKRPAPLLMNTLFAKGLKEIRHYSHSYLSNETSRPPLKHEYTQLGDAFRSNEADREGGGLVRSVTDLQSRNNRTKADAPKSLGSSPTNLRPLPGRLGSQQTFAQDPYQKSTASHRTRPLGSQLPVVDRRKINLDLSTAGSKVNKSRQGSDSVWKGKSRKPVPHLTAVGDS